MESILQTNIMLNPAIHYRHFKVFRGPLEGSLLLTIITGKVFIRAQQYFFLNSLILIQQSVVNTVFISNGFFNFMYLRNNAVAKTFLISPTLFLVNDYKFYSSKFSGRHRRTGRDSYNFSFLPCCYVWVKRSWVVCVVYLPHHTVH